MASCKKESEAEISPFLTNPDYTGLEHNQKVDYLDSILHNQNFNRNTTAKRDLIFTIAAEYYYLNEPHKSLAVSRKALRFANEAKDTLAQARANYYIGDTYEITRKDSAYYYYLEAEKLFRLKNDNNGIARMLFNKAYILFFEGNYVESEIELAKAMQLLINSNENELLYSSYTLMGANMEKLEEYDDAIKYYNQARELIPKLEKGTNNFDTQYNYKVVSALNIANIYEQKKEYQKSIQELQKFLNSNIQKNWPGEYSKVLANLAYSRMKSGDLDNVEQMFLEALKISERYSNSSDILYKLNNLGEYYLLKKDTAKAKDYLLRSLKMGEQIRSGEEVKTALKFLSKADAPNSEFYENRYIFLNDSLAKVQRKNRNKYARIEYETVILKDENKTLSQKYSSILIISALLILIVIFLLALRYFTNQKRDLQSRRQKQLADEEIFNLLKQQQIKILQTKEQEQNRISRDLHDGILNKIYGVRLQLGILNRSDDADSKQRRMQYIDMLQQIEKEIRALSHDLHVDQLYEQFDFQSLLATLIIAQNELGVAKFELDTDAEINWDAVSGIIKITIYRILQEASLNVIKYAEAENCRISIRQVSDEIQVEIADNGKGFELAAKTDGGIGLKNMRDRLKSLNSALKINSRIGNGTEIAFSIKI